MSARILIGALSAVAYNHRREMCRKTWFNRRWITGDVDAVFLLGSDDHLEPSRSCDLLWLPCDDSYSRLPQKTRWFCRWALEFKSWDWLFKTDDDAWTHIPRLQACVESLPAETEYFGQEPGAKWRGYCSGAGYGLSRRAAQIVADKLTQETGAEDLLVGRHLKRAGIHPHFDHRFIPFGSMDLRPMPSNDLITTHKVGEDVFAACQADFGG